ncbi:MAG TPA: hypothetical protein VNV39_09875 [Stellaceae bacterium]|nr:hypothetical protein [Stellaceae bacterium]
MHDRVAPLRRKPASDETMHASEPVHPFSHIDRLSLGGVLPICGVVADHRAIVVEGSAAQGDGARKSRHHRGQSRRAAIVLSYPQAAAVNDLAAKAWNFTLHDKPRIGRERTFREPQRQRSDQVIKVVNNKPAQTIGCYRLAVVVLRQKPKVAIAEFDVPHVERLIQMTVSLGTSDQSIISEIGENLQIYSRSFKPL